MKVWHLFAVKEIKEYWRLRCELEIRNTEAVERIAEHVASFSSSLLKLERVIATHQLAEQDKQAQGGRRDTSRKKSGGRTS